jgi:hypothetical protein
LIRASRRSSRLSHDRSLRRRPAGAPLDAVRSAGTTDGEAERVADRSVIAQALATCRRAGGRWSSRVAVRLATLDDGGPTGGLFNDDGRIPW